MLDVLSYITFNQMLTMQLKAAIRRAECIGLLHALSRMPDASANKARVRVRLNAAPSQQLQHNRTSSAYLLPPYVEDGLGTLLIKRIRPSIPVVALCIEEIGADKLEVRLAINRRSSSCNASRFKLVTRNLEETLCVIREGRCKILLLWLDGTP
jgi:hypothetical protein